LIDKNSFKIYGYFRENMLKNIDLNASAKVELMAYPHEVLNGKVESIGWGIYPSDGNPGQNLLPKVKPVFQWIRLAQRIPVVIKLDEESFKRVKLRVGMSATVKVLSNKIDNNTSLISKLSNLF